MLVRSSARKSLILGFFEGGGGFNFVFYVVCKIYLSLQSKPTTRKPLPDPALLPPEESFLQLFSKACAGKGPTTLYPLVTSCEDILKKTA